MLKIKITITDTLDKAKAPTHYEFGLIKEVHKGDMLEWVLEQLIPKLRVALARSGLLESQK